MEVNKKKVITLTFDQGSLLIQTDNPQSLQDTVGSNVLVFDPRVPGWRCDAIFYSIIRKAGLPTDFELKDEVGKWNRLFWTKVQLPKLRKEQQEAILAWMKKRQGVVVMPTGTGKTEVALALMAELGVSTLVVAPVRDLMYQWHHRIYRALKFDAGIVGDNTFDIRPVSVTTYDSAYIHMGTLGNRFELVIFDECHHLPGRNRREAAHLCAAPLRLGLTATPERADGLGKDLEFLIGPRVYELPLDALRGNTLADYEVIRIPIHLSQEEQERYNENSKILRIYMMEKTKENKAYEWKDLLAETGKDPQARAAQKAFYTMKSIQDRAGEKLRVLEDIFRLHLGERVIVFTGSNAMARDVSLRFLVPCLLSHSGKKERREILEGFTEGTYPVLVANRVLDEGVDLPEAKIAVVLGGLTSTRQATQRLGRILRKSGNKNGILYEVVCQETSDVHRSRKRRKSDAYKGTRHQRI